MNIIPKFPRWRRVSSVDEMCSLLAVLRNGATLTKGGQLAFVIELDGAEYTGLSDSMLYSLFNDRLAFLDSLPPNVTVMTFTKRVETKPDFKAVNSSIPMSARIGMRWRDNFRVCYRTLHYVVLLGTPDDMAGQLLLLSGSKSAIAGYEDGLHQATLDALSRLKKFGARLLTGSDVASFWGSLLNGRELRQQVSAMGLMDGLLAECSISWPAGKQYQIYRGARDRYSAWLIFKAPANGTSNELFIKLCQLNREFCITQTFSKMPKEAALSTVEDKVRNVGAWRRHNDTMQLELAELLNRMQADEISLFRHRWAVEVFGWSEQELEAAVTSVRSVLEDNQYRVSRERVNQEALFWSRFPEKQGLNPRQRFVTSHNAAHMTAFPSVGQGLSRCSWGDEPVSYFRTESGSEYGFTFHSSPKKDALGNTLVIGGAGSGKTTLISFLLSQSFKFPGFRALCFDRMNGLEVFTNMHDGEYLSSADYDAMTFNPLLLPETGSNKGFLMQWFMALANTQREERHQHQAEIGTALRALYTLKPEDRTLANIVDAFGRPEQGNVADRLSLWKPGGTYGAYFNGQHDALNFAKPLVTLDMTTLLDIPDVLAPMALYLFHKLFQNVTGTHGFAVFVDEIPRYLDSPQFGPQIDVLLREVRKLNGIFIGACQDAPTVIASARANVFLPNVETYILFSDTHAKREDYIDIIGLNENEFDWIKSPHEHQVLVKRKEGASAVLDVNLSALGTLLKVFDSSKAAVRRLKDLKANGENSYDWKGEYLNS